MRTKRLVEGFIDRYYESDYEIAKTYDCGVLVSIEIIPKSDGKSVFIWNSKYFDVKPQDDDLTVELEMQTFEQKLLEESGEEDMRETIDYFLSDPDLLCLCADYGDFTDVEAINDDETLDDIICNHVKPVLYEIGAIVDEDEDDNFAEIVAKALVTNIDLTICGVRLFLSKVKQSDFEEMEEV